MAAGDAAWIVARALRIARRDPDRNVDVEDGLSWLNECHRALLTDGTPWSFLEVHGEVTLAAGSSNYSFSSLATALSIDDGVERVLAVTNDTDGARPLRGLPWSEFERFTNNSEGDPQGSPWIYTQIGLGDADPTIRFWPTPDAAYTMGVLVRKAIPELGAADFPLIPAAHASAVLTPYVAARMWDQQAGPDAAGEANRHDLRHERAVRRLIEAYGSARQEDVLLEDPTALDYLDHGPAVW